MINIKKVKIQNFRSFRNSDNEIVDLSNINVFVGQNNVGKTNILRAIYLFFYPQTYNALSDQNMIKQITGGASQHPKISIEFLDNEIIKYQESTYTITCDLNYINEPKKLYKISNTKDDVKQILSKGSVIQKYIANHFKCVYLSTTDSNIEKQTTSLINELFFKYFQKQSNEVKNTIKNFEDNYKKLFKTIESNISSIEEKLMAQFTNVSEFGISPKFCIDKTGGITEFILEKIKLKLDDTYVQDIGNKGAGIQRASLILLCIFLVKEILVKENKIILLDEPEAYLYPLLIQKIKAVLEESTKENEKFEIFMTTHSISFIECINDSLYKFFCLEQKVEEESYSRSRNNTDMNKYSVISEMNSRNKNKILKNYGLLDKVNDYEYVILCEGETDKNYLVEILKDKKCLPQIRFEKYLYIENNKEKDLPYDHIGKGTEAIPHTLMFLEKCSPIHRKVLVLLDGDEAGQNVKDKIKPSEYNNLDVHVHILPKGKQIEDVVFSKEAYIRKVLKNTPELNDNKYRSNFTNAINTASNSVIEQTCKFAELYRINIRIDKIKHFLSIDLSRNDINRDWILEELNELFYSSDSDLN